MGDLAVAGNPGDLFAKCSGIKAYSVVVSFASPLHPLILLR